MHEAVAQVVAESSGAVNQLPIPPVAYGLIAFGALLSLLAIVYAFRHAGSRR